MNRLFVALLALPLLAAQAAAQCNTGGCLNLGFGAKISLFGNVGCGPAPPCGGGPGPGQAGPWYLYWPQEAHFQTPAPTGYPYWPSSQTLPTGTGFLPPGSGANYLQPAAYNPGTPGYWYGR